MNSDFISNFSPQSAEAVEFADCISKEGWDIPPPNNYPIYDIKPSNDKAPALEIWGMWNPPSVPLLTGPLWSSLIYGLNRTDYVCK